MIRVWAPLLARQSKFPTRFLCSSSQSEEYAEVSHRATTVAWVQSIRRHKTRTFLIVNDGTSPDNLQVVAATHSLPEGIAVGSAVQVTGTVGLAPNGAAELRAEGTPRLLSPPLHAAGEVAAGEEAAAAVVVGAMSRSRPRLGLLRSAHGLPWRHRLPEMAAVLRLRAAAKATLHRAMRERGYLEVDTPILTTTDCEGAGETFLVTPTSGGKGVEEPSAPLHLTVSAQLHLEALSLGMNKVYTLGPTFRAEPSHSRFHLAEFLMLEAESVAMTTTDALCDEIEAVVRGIAVPYLDFLASTSHKDLGLVLSYLSESPGSKTPEDHLRAVEFVLTRPFTRMTFTEACEHLKALGMGRATEGGFNKEEEQALCSSVAAGGGGVFVTDFPANQKAFYCARSSENVAAAVDLLIPGIGEMVGGSVREAEREAVAERMPGGERGTLDWYADLRGHGGAPHGGFGLGLDRMLLWLLGVYNIRDTVAFPREIGKMYL